jgi:hypothetical protein
MLAERVLGLTAPETAALATFTLQDVPDPARALRTRSVRVPLETHPQPN